MNNFLESIKNINGYVNNLVWGVPAMVCIMGVGLLLLFKTKAIQFRKFGAAIKATVGKLFHKENSDDKLKKFYQKQK